MTNNQPFIIERTFDAPASKIWKAITDKDEMKKWYFDLKEFKPEVGFEFRFPGGPDENRQYLHICKITEVIPNKKLSYSWRYEGYKGETLVTFELSEENGKTNVRLTHAGLESFGENNNPDLDRKNFEAGWTDIIGRSLADYLSK